MSNKLEVDWSEFMMLEVVPLWRDTGRGHRIVETSRVDAMLADGWEPWGVCGPNRDYLIMCRHKPWEYKRAGISEDEMNLLSAGGWEPFMPYQSKGEVLYLIYRRKSAPQSDAKAFAETDT